MNPRFGFWEEYYKDQRREFSEDELRISEEYFSSNRKASPDFTSKRNSPLRKTSKDEKRAMGREVHITLSTDVKTAIKERQDFKKSL